MSVIDINNSDFGLSPCDEGVVIGREHLDTLIEFASRNAILLGRNDVETIWVCLAEALCAKDKGDK